MKPYYIILIRPVGSSCWTTKRIATTPEGAEKYATEERNEKVRFADGSVHLQSTAIIHALLPDEIDKTQQHFEAEAVAMTRRGIP